MVEAITAVKYRNFTDLVQPGAIGSVGDVLGSVRLHQSTPQMTMRWDKVFSPGNSKSCGSNIQDGQQVSWESGFGGARVVSSNWGGRRQFRTNRGYQIEDIRPADMLVEPFISSLGDYTWRNKIATTYQALRTGKNFLPVPGPYQLAPGEIGRGGRVPMVMATAGVQLDGEQLPGGDNAVVDATTVAPANPGVSGAYGYRQANQNLNPIFRGPDGARQPDPNPRMR